MTMPWMKYKELPTHKHVFDETSKTWTFQNQNYNTNWICSYDTNKVQVLTAEVHPGDMLYLPAFWFHRVEQDDHTLAVNYWYDYDYLNPNYVFIELLKKMRSI